MLWQLNFCMIFLHLALFPYLSQFLRGLLNEFLKALVKSLLHVKLHLILTHRKIKLAYFAPLITLK